jgi:hypothetical protein
MVGMEIVIGRSKIGGVLLLIGSALVSTANQAATDERAERVLREAASASGEAHWAGVQFVRVKAKIATSGLHGTVETLFDARTGRYRESQQLGPIEGADGFDGTIVPAAIGTGRDFRRTLPICVAKR